MPDSFDLPAWCRSRPWWLSVDIPARAGHTVVVHDPTAPEEYRDWRRAGLLTYETPDGHFASHCGSIHVFRGKRPDVHLRIIERKADAR